MYLNLEELNILANNITTIGQAILTEAAVLEAEVKASENEANNELQLKATQLNILGNLVVLIGDFIGTLLTQYIFDQSLEKGEELSDADRHDLAGSWLSVAGDYLSLLAAVEEANEKENEK